MIYFINTYTNTYLYMLTLRSLLRGCLIQGYTCILTATMVVLLSVHR